MADPKVNSRYAEVILFYKGINITSDLKEYLTSFTYNDGEGRSDDIAIDLIDRDRKWQGPWLPGKGDEISATIRTRNWYEQGDSAELNCGTFYVDDVSLKGPPDKISIKALAVPFAAGGKGEQKSRSWENADFATIAGEVAKSSELSLIFDAPNHVYDRVDQYKETDLAFIKRLAKKEGYSVKVTNKQLVIYAAAKYEAKSAALAFTRGDELVLDYSFSDTAADEQYAKSEVSYFDEKTKKTLKYTFVVPGIDEGPTLKINKRVKSIDEAQRLAKAEVREKNKGAKTAKFTIVGHVKCVQGLTVTVKGFGAFDGKYFIESTSHGVGNGYKVNVNLREVLPY